MLSFVMLHHVIDWEAALRDAVRVLTPRGTLIGYDLLSTAPARALHLADGSTHRLLRFDELRALAQLPVGQAILMPGLGGLVGRFILRHCSKGFEKAGAEPGDGWRRRARASWAGADG